MPKRKCPFTENQHAIKKQETNNGNKGRQILSPSSERALQLLYIGAANQFNAKVERESVSGSNLIICSQCTKTGENEIKCCYCDKFLCCDCLESCNQCEQEYCKNCIFNLCDKGYSICYSCY